MRITKTRAQAEAEEQARQAAYEQTQECPECGAKYKEVVERDIGTYEKIMILISPVKVGDKGEYFCRCLNCGAEWETDSF